MKHVEVEPPNSDAGLRAVLQRADRLRGARHWTPGGHSLLVEIFLCEGDSDAAFAKAKAGGCSEELWLRFVLAREAPSQAQLYAADRNAATITRS